jgi:hypothetical protein
MIGAETLVGRPDLETTRKGHTPEAPEAQKRAVEGGLNGTSSCPVEKAKRSPSKNFCRRPYGEVAVTRHGASVGEGPREASES